MLGGRYAVGPALGVGASATVHEAIDTTLGRRVAVKVLHAALAADEGFLARFRAEARAAAALSHPNILRVYDWGEGPEQPWLVSELMTGGSLRDMLDRGHLLSIAQARRLGSEAASALDHAHRRGLVHRDIKPANLLFDEEGRVVIADFGLARALAEAAVTEPSGALLGTARYASPEQARGLSVDGRADVYALALVLIEAVTGKVPFSADTTIGTLMARVGNDLHPPVDVGPLVPALARAGRALADSRADAGRFAADLAAVAGEVGRADRLPVSTDSASKTKLRPAADADRTEHGTTAPVVGVKPKHGRPRRRFGLGLRVLSVVAAIALVATGVVVSGVLVPTRTVPGVVNDHERAAMAELKTAGLEGEVTRRVYRDGTQAGQVLEQTPDPGAARKANKPVGLVVSRGPEPVDVPNLGGRTEQEARALLEGAGLTVGDRKTQYDPNPKGTVINWVPNAGRAPKGSPVNIVVSDGPPPVEVPNLAGKSAEEAAATLQGLGFEVVREKVFHDTVAPTFLVNTNPGAGEQAPHGSKVTVRESKGPELVTVPDVEGQTVQQATATLERAGLKVGAIEGRGRRGQVEATDPPAGEKVRKGSAVDLFVV